MIGHGDLFANMVFKIFPFIVLQVLVFAISNLSIITVATIACRPIFVYFHVKKAIVPHLMHLITPTFVYSNYRNQFGIQHLQVDALSRWIHGHDRAIVQV